MGLTKQNKFSWLPYAMHVTLLSCLLLAFARKQCRWGQNMGQCRKQNLGRKQHQQALQIAGTADAWRRACCIKWACDHSEGGAASRAPTPMHHVLPAGFSRAACNIAQLKLFTARFFSRFSYTPAITTCCDAASNA